MNLKHITLFIIILPLIIGCGTSKEKLTPVKTKLLETKKLPTPPKGFEWRSLKNIAVLKPSTWFEYKTKDIYTTSLESIEKNGIFETGLSIQSTYNIQKEQGAPALVGAIQYIEKIQKNKANKIFQFKHHKFQNAQNLEAFTITYRNAPLAAKPIIVHKYIQVNNIKSYVNIITFESPEKTWNQHWKNEGIPIFSKIVSFNYK